MWLIGITLPLVAFLLGSIPFGLIISKSKGIDIRKHGSGNIGATNVLRVMGKKYGIPCLLLDALKGFIPVVLAINLMRIEGRGDVMHLDFFNQWGLLVKTEYQFFGQLCHVLTALAAILGHNYSPWIGFKGGKGVATSAGVLIALMPFAILILIIVWLLVFLLSRYVSLASIVAALALPVITLYGSWHHGLLQTGRWNKPLFGLSCMIAVLAVYQHRNNIERLRNGTENRFKKS